MWISATAEPERRRLDPFVFLSSEEKRRYSAAIQPRKPFATQPRYPSTEEDAMAVFEIVSRLGRGAVREKMRQNRGHIRARPAHAPHA